jgi:hypothetical protein
LIPSRNTVVIGCGGDVATGARGLARILIGANRNTPKSHVFHAFFTVATELQRPIDGMVDSAVCEADLVSVEG